MPVIVSDIGNIPMRFIAAGSFSAGISSEKGDLYLWGTGSFGEFQSPHRVKSIQGSTQSVAIGNQFGCAVTSDCFLYSWGVNTTG